MKVSPEFQAVFFRRIAGLLLLLGCGSLIPCALADPEAAKEQVFKLREASVFDSHENRLQRGQAVPVQDEPMAAVKAYPAFHSKKPVYGAAPFAAKYGETNAGMLFYFAVDESQGTGKGYDRLYFDLNQDLDLRNDRVLQPRSAPENARLSYTSIKQQVIFDFLSIEFDFGPAGKRPVEVMPRLTISAYSGDPAEYKYMYFVRTRLQEGTIRVAGQEYEARLGNDYLIFGRLDLPETALMLSSKSRSQPRISWWGGDRLSAMHKWNGQFFTFSAPPDGSELRVKKYEGDLGVFQVGTGGRSLGTVNARGSLQSTNCSVAVGDIVKDGWPEATSRCELPVGDYLPAYLTVGYGRLNVELSQNYHSDGTARGRGSRQKVHAFTVRKDKPFVLDFSNKPEVMFAAPAKDARVKVGEELTVKAVLIDPKLDIMIRGLDDTSRKQTKAADGKPLNYERNLSLDPTVTITRANGEKVADGVMPFG